jgi:hypothetical protein
MGLISSQNALGRKINENEAMLAQPCEAIRQATVDYLVKTIGVV